MAARGLTVAILDLDQNKTLFRWFTQHKPDIQTLTVEAATPETFNAVLDATKNKRPDLILIDIAGAYEATIIKAIAVSSLVITPAKLSEPDLREAVRILSEVLTFNKHFNVEIEHRLLVNEAESLNPIYQRHSLKELEASDLVRFETLLQRRAPYREIFITGMPPHFADKMRPPILKAISELDALTDEVLALTNLSTKKLAHDEGGKANTQPLWSWGRTQSWRIVKSTMVKAHISGLQACPKGLRHGFGVHAVRTGVPLNILQKWLGHSSMETTAIYANATGPEERDIAERMWS